MSIEENKALARRFEIEHPTASYARSPTRSSRRTSPSTSISPARPNPLDRDAWKQLVAGFRGAFADMRHQVEEEIPGGDAVVVRWTGAAAHPARCKASRPPVRS